MCAEAWIAFHPDYLIPSETCSLLVYDVMFKKRAGMFDAPRGFRPDKTRAASFLNGFKIFLEKRVSREFITMMLL